jgi:hypothetical protein
MADVKISGLPASTVPLAGTEVLPLVQGGITKQVSVANLTTLPSSAFASLPTASTVTGQIYRVTDIGINGSLWRSNGTIWVPNNNTISLLTGCLPFLIAPTSSIAATTGVITFGTAIPTYLLASPVSGSVKCYMYYPAGAWTGSTAGWYYTTITNSTTGTVYSNQYTTGQPTVPTSPTLVTTGAGAFVGVTGIIKGPNVAMPANFIAPYNLLKIYTVQGNNNSAGTKLVGYGNNDFSSAWTQAMIGNTTSLSASANLVISVVGNNAATGWLNTGGYNLQFNVVITSAVSHGFFLQTSVATDWVSLSVYDLVLVSQ